MEIPDNVDQLRHAVGEFCIRFLGTPNSYTWLSKARTYAFDENSVKARRAIAVGNAKLKKDYLAGNACASVVCSSDIFFVWQALLRRHRL
jgi:hypothetical protein